MKRFIYKASLFALPLALPAFALAQSGNFSDVDSAISTVTHIGKPNYSASNRYWSVGILVGFDQLCYSWWRRRKEKTGSRYNDLRYHRALRDGFRLGTGPNSY